MTKAPRRGSRNFRQGGFNFLTILKRKKKKKKGGGGGQKTGGCDGSFPSAEVYM